MASDVRTPGHRNATSAKEVADLSRPASGEGVTADLLISTTDGEGDGHQAHK